MTGHGGTGAPLFASPRISAERRADASVLLRSEEPLGPYAPSMAHVFRTGTERHPERVLAAARDGEGWTTVTWGEARERADALAEALLGCGLGPHRPLMVLSGNSLEHLMLALAAYTAGVPLLPVSAAYSLMSRDHDRVRGIVAGCAPGMVFADDAGPFAAALDAIASEVPMQMIARGRRPGALRYEELAATTPETAVERAYERVGPDTVAKLLFTSGSTGVPKGVVNTHRMLCSNQQALGQIWPFLHDEPPVLVDWLPWSHTFGGNHNLGQVLTFGGTLYIDDGRPAPGLFDRTVDALRQVPPTVYYNVPAGYALLAPRLEGDRDFAVRFFSRLRFMFYASAALSQALWDRLRAVAAAAADHEVPLTASWGTTETAPAATSAHFMPAACGCIGVPLPGVTLKLVPQGDRLEVCLTGPNVTPGYHGDPDATAAAFDEEGFYRTGDAVRPVDERDPGQGLMFDGRLAEDFKLSSGTWVTMARVRSGLLSASGALDDAVIAGHDRDYVGALAWLGDEEVRTSEDPVLRAQLAARLENFNRDAGSASRVERLLLLEEAPDLDAGEVTDKGYVNQRAVLERRAGAVARLYAEPPDSAVIVAGG